MYRPDKIERDLDLLFTNLTWLNRCRVYFLRSKSPVQKRKEPMQNKFAFFIAFVVGDGDKAGHRDVERRGMFETGYQHGKFLSQMRRVSLSKARQ